MTMKFSQFRLKLLIVLLSSAVLITVFQNCGGGEFELASVGGAIGSDTHDPLSEDPPTTPDPGSDPSPVPNPAPPLTPLPPMQAIEVNYSGIKAKALNLSPGHWVEIQTTNKIMDVAPKSQETTWAISGPASVVTAWCGGALGKDSLFIWGGGHMDYGGNEVYRLRLTDLTWERLTNPSKYIEPCSPVCKTIDDTPTSAHSYDGVQYIFEVDRLWVGSGSGYPSGNGAPQSYFFNVQNLTWEKKKVERVGWLGSDWDPITKLVLINDNAARLTAWDPLSDTYHNTSSANWSVSDTSSALDWRTRKYISLSGDRKGGRLLYWDLKDVKFRDPTSKIPWNQFAQTYRVEGDTLVKFMPPTSNRMGLEYDPDTGFLVAWDGGPSVWTLNTETWIWTEITPKSVHNPNRMEESNSTREKTRGIYGRWRYIPSLKVFFGYNDVNGNPWLFKMP